MVGETIIIFLKVKCARSGRAPNASLVPHSRVSGVLPAPWRRASLQGRPVRCGARVALAGGGRRGQKYLQNAKAPAKHFCKVAPAPLTVCMPPPTLYTSYSAYTAPRTGGCNSRYRCNLARLYTVQYAVSTQRRGVVQSYLLPPPCLPLRSGGRPRCVPLLITPLQASPSRSASRPCVYTPLRASRWGVWSTRGTGRPGAVPALSSGPRRSRRGS